MLFGLETLCEILFVLGDWRDLCFFFFFCSVSQSGTVPAFDDWIKTKSCIKLAVDL